MDHAATTDPPRGVDPLAETAAVEVAERMSGVLEALRGEIESLRHAGQEGASEKSRLAQRRARLCRQRGLLAEKADQLLRARDALAAKLADLERTRHAHAATVAPPAAFAPAPARVSRGGGWKEAGFAALLIGAALVGEAAFAWWLAGQIDRPVVQAQTLIAMEKTSTAPSAEAVKTWMSFHEELTRDPQLLERAAQQMKARGYTDLATPTDLRRRLETDLSVEASEPGTLALSLKGVGKLRTERVLETYAGVLVSLANDGRSRRLDKCSTHVPHSAAGSGLAIAEARLPIFGAGAGMLWALTLGGAVLAWRAARARAARRPKNETALANEGGEERWAIRLDAGR